MCVISGPFHQNHYQTIIITTKILPMKFLPKSMNLDRDKTYKRHTDISPELNKVYQLNQIEMLSNQVT